MKPAILQFLILFFFSSTSALSAQNTADQFWAVIAESKIPGLGKRQIVPQKYLTFQLNETAMKNKLFSAPQEGAVRINQSTCVLSLPLPDGSIQKFKVIESPIMSGELYLAYPNIRTYSVKGIDDIYANGKLDWNEFGFHGMIRTVNGDFFVDPYCVGDTKNYITYYTSDFTKAHPVPDAEVDFIISDAKKKSGLNEQSGETPINSRSANTTNAVFVGDQLRTYRLAVTCTGEYAVAATGTNSPSIAQTLSKIVTSVNRVDGVYETDFAVRLVLVPTQTMVIFTNAATDPYTANNHGPALLGQSHTVITNTIGTANFDIGHIFSTGGGGIAFLGSVCSSADKGRGVTGSTSPVGDPFDIDYVAHEIGHQFNGNHTFNSITGSCNSNRNGSTSGEPGSGVTIMGYAGLCGSNDLALRSIAYFHPFSYDEIVNFTNNGSGSNCNVTTATGNQAPLVTGSGDFYIPKGTAFSLTGSAVDPDNDPLTYSWEETDAGSGNGANWNSGTKPFFRSYAPTISPTRYFPNSSVVLSGNYTGTKGEYVPQSPQVLEFRLTVRDNKMGGGGVGYAINTVTVDNSGPFVITYPTSSGIVWNSGSQQTVTWDVNGTNLSPVSCSFVRISLSMDGGVNYTMLISSTPNDGTELVNCPVVPSNMPFCRIKVESAGNIFYDVSNNDFTISTSTVPTSTDSVSVNTGIRQVSKNNPLGVFIWPNPVNNLLNVSMNNLLFNQTTELRIIDVLGHTILQKNYANKVEIAENIDLTNITNGLYFIYVSNGENRSFYRLIKN